MSHEDLASTLGMSGKPTTPTLGFDSNGEWLSSEKSCAPRISRCATAPHGMSPRLRDLLLLLLLLLLLVLLLVQTRTAALNLCKVEANWE